MSFDFHTPAGLQVTDLDVANPQLGPVFFNPPLTPPGQKGDVYFQSSGGSSAVSAFGSIRHMHKTLDIQKYD